MEPMRPALRNMLVSRLGEEVVGEYERILTSRGTHVSPEDTEKLFDLHRRVRTALVEGIAASTFGDEEKAQAWLDKPCRALGNRVPRTLLGTSEDNEVIAELGRIEHGIIA